MALFNWTEAYSVGIMTIDVQHKRLVEMINSLHDAMRTGKGNDVTAKMVNEMAVYAVRHFGEEEKYMQQHNYPQFAAHKAEHDAFKQKVNDLQHKLRDQKIGVTLEVMTFLKDWLSKHILEVDKRYGPFLKEHGVH